MKKGWNLVFVISIGTGAVREKRITGAQRDIQDPKRATVRLYDAEKGWKEDALVGIGEYCASISYSRSYLRVQHKQRTINWIVL